MGFNIYQIKSITNAILKIKKNLVVEANWSEQLGDLAWKTARRPILAIELRHGGRWRVNPSYAIKKSTTD